MSCDCNDFPIMSPAVILKCCEDDDGNPIDVFDAAIPSGNPYREDLKAACWATWRYAPISSLCVPRWIQRLTDRCALMDRRYQLIIAEYEKQQASLASLGYGWTETYKDVTTPTGTDVRTVSGSDSSTVGEGKSSRSGTDTTTSEASTSSKSGTDTTTAEASTSSKSGTDTTTAEASTSSKSSTDTTTAEKSTSTSTTTNSGTDKSVRISEDLPMTSGASTGDWISARETTTVTPSTSSTVSGSETPGKVTVEHSESGTETPGKVTVEHSESGTETPGKVTVEHSEQATEDARTTEGTRSETVTDKPGVVTTVSGTHEHSEQGGRTADAFRQMMDELEDPYVRYARELKDLFLDYWALEGRGCCCQ